MTATSPKTVARRRYNPAMGTWGTGIFDDDTAADLREDFKDALAKGMTAEAATKKLVATYGPQGDEQVAPVFWLALAVTQWALGCLIDSVKEEALRAITGGSDLARWESPKDQKKRNAVLEKVAKQLASPQPKAKKPRQRYQQVCDWQRG